MSSSSRLEIRAALASDLPALAARALLTRQHGLAFSLQLGADAWTLTADEAPIAAAGFWPGDGFREAWLMVTPALRSRRILPRAVPMIAEQLQRLYDPALPTIAAVALDNRGGRSLATRLGFIDAGDHPLYASSAMFVLAAP